MSQAPAPVSKRKTFKELGTPTAQAAAFAAERTELTPEELRAAAERERERLEAAGEIDRVGDRQGDTAPKFDTLVGRWLEIRWRYYVTDPVTKKRTPEYIWCEGEVVEVATGAQKRSARCKSPLPWGALRIRHAARICALARAAPLTPARACPQVAR